ncbi:MAG: hypothetical protein AB8B58_07495 [Roseobacter sp.]
MSSDTPTVQEAKNRIKVALRELYRIRRAARYNDPAHKTAIENAITALKAEHAQLSGIGPDTRYSIVTDGFKEVQGDLQTIVDERHALIDTMKRARKATDAVTRVLGLFT